MFGSQPRIGLFEVCKSPNTVWDVCECACARACACMRSTEVRYQIFPPMVPKFSTNGFQPWVGLFEVCKSLKTCPKSGYPFGMCVCVRARMRAHEVNKGQVPNFSTIGSQPRIGLFEVCKSLNTCPVSGWVDGMCVSVRARAHARAWG